MSDEFVPHEILCFALRARDGKPPHPEDDPQARIVVYSQQEVDEAKRTLVAKYPGSWIMEHPLD